MKIKLIGNAGQGIKTISLILSKIFTENGKYVCFSLNYGTNVRSGIITSDIIYSDEKIENPKIITPDIAVILSNANKTDFKNSEVISYEETDFEKISFNAFKKARFANMIAMGKLLRLLKFDFKKINFKDKLPEKFQEKNIEAIKLGYDLK
ncbi:2-oxoacid:acceptor oxidoreductase family protein [Candidatus Woesearchaeota archaeon]|nr:2-oxoacid:acceptor oxidoreductase family protein [Candidatus Woesearchaeota archaeon]